MSQSQKIALVTGANRGLGLQACKVLAELNYHVLLTSRNKDKGIKAADDLRNQGFNVIFHPLDVTDADSIQVLAAFVQKQYSRLDALINNAGIFPDAGKGQPSNSIFDTSLDTVRAGLETNTLGALAMAQTFIPMMRGNGRVVNISSGMGQLSDMNGCCPGYRLSKTAINAVTRIFADELQGTNVKINSVCPGWVRTDMGGANADRPIEEGVGTIIWLATLPDDGPSGGFFRDKQLIPW
ncbi:MAG TPA: short-chain dehydrogenase [Gammaproteobacteria bacterium]|nr:short-chain dehydrogenase [Gammaproteobacteria bacterium]